MPSGHDPSPTIHKTTLKTSLSSPPRPWHSQLTLDLLVLVLSRTLFHPFLAALLPLCLRALAAPYDSSSFILTCAFAVSVSLYRILGVWNRRLAYGVPRDIDWEHELVVITGGVGGLGGCIAEIFALKGVGVAVLDVAVDGTRFQDGEEKEGVKNYACNVGNYEQAENVWKNVVRDMGTPTILINNAAMVDGKPFLEQTIEDVERTFRVNTLSHYHLTSLFLSSLLERPCGGTLVTISSVLAYLGASHLSAYTASKAALLAYHASLSAELASTAPQIKTILVAPGQLDTQLFGNVKLRGWWRNFFGPVVGAGEVAVRIVEMIDRGEGGVISEPAYASWIAWLGVLPVGVQTMMRGWTGIDDAFARPVEEASETARKAESSEGKRRRDVG
jgi:NAD(P)-dependent dehydrogenase (short-subunit alcohol dehydrogenase family)